MISINKDSNFLSHVRDYAGFNVHVKASSLMSEQLIFIVSQGRVVDNAVDGCWEFDEIHDI